MSTSKRPADANYGCSDSGCIFGHPGGMATSGGCKCLWFDRNDVDARMNVRRGILALRSRIVALEDVAVMSCVALRDAKYVLLAHELEVTAMECSQAVDTLQAALDGGKEVGK